MANSNVSEIVATTLEHRSGALADNVSSHNAILAKLKSEGGIKTFSGGRIIYEELMYAENPNANWYSGYDTLPTAAAETMSAAEFTIKQASVPVVISGLELLQNSGREQMIDLLESKMTNAEYTMKNLINEGIYSDGTGSAGKTITGLQAAVVISPTSGTYGGIDRSTWSFWRNKKSKGSGTDFAGSLTTSNVASVYTNLWTQLIRGSDKPNLIVADETHFAVYVTSLQPQQRFTDPKMAALGFDNVMFMSAPVVMESTASGIPSGTTYFLNTKYLKLRPHAQRNMVSASTGKRYAVNQDAEVQHLLWAGNLTCSGAQFQGIVQN